MKAKEVAKNIFYVGVNDLKIDLFEGQYKVPNGMCYNSYVIVDNKIAVMDTVDKEFTHEWLDNLANVLNDKQPDYLIVQHMEPDHSANVVNFLKTYSEAKVVVNAKSLAMLKQFFDYDFDSRAIVVANGETLDLGEHQLVFTFAPMVHWPEVMMTYDKSSKTIFTADAFGKFGAYDVDEPWEDEARRYYIGIVGKYGVQVQNVLKKVSELEIETICPLHGPVLNKNIEKYVKLYDTWSSYTPEENGILIAYNSVYGNTKQAAEYLFNACKKNGADKLAIYDLARTDMSLVVAEAFRYSKIVFAGTTYNAELYPCMEAFLTNLVERNFKNRTVAIVENGTWAPMVNKLITKKLENSKGITYVENMVTIKSAVNKDVKENLDNLAKELCVEFIAQNEETANKNDMTALFNIGYGLYVVTSNDGRHDNGLIVNSVNQVADNPTRISVTINKANYSHHVIKQTGKMVVNCLDTSAPFSLFQNFGFQSGRNVDKFKDYKTMKADNGLPFLDKYINSFMALQVEEYVDLGSHGMFICSITEARVINKNESMTYAYYHKNVKPKPKKKINGWVCKICGYIYEGDVLPDDFICPLCKHGAVDFERIQ